MEEPVDGAGQAKDCTFDDGHIETFMPQLGRAI
jgi:hypothetical protein